MHRDFLTRSERLLQIHKERASTHDGLKHLDDKALVRKVREGPNKLKASLKDTLNKLDKNGVSLTEQGEINWSEIPHKSIHKYVRENENLIKTILM